jgi:ferredoxin
VNICQDKAITYRLINLSGKEHKTDENKRRLLAGSLLMLLGIQVSARSDDKKTPVPKKETTIPENRSFPVSPPGAGSIADLNKNCTACSLCINACPNGVLQPAVKEYGIMGFIQPVMNYRRSFCTYNCTVCTEVCPTNALKPLMPEAKKLTQIGKTTFVKDNCIVKTEKTACGACAEVCPTKAVYMIPYEGNLLIPEVNTDFCIGCGHCEYACPTNPYRAIFVDGNEVHKAAKKPGNTRSEIQAPSEFPF